MDAMSKELVEVWEIVRYMDGCKEDEMQYAMQGVMQNKKDGNERKTDVVDLTVIDNEK